jgi:hypothetical protein
MIPMYVSLSPSSEEEASTTGAESTLTFDLVSYHTTRGTKRQRWACMLAVQAHSLVLAVTSRKSHPGRGGDKMRF